MTRILLIRHGRSSHVHDGRWIDAVAAREFERLYDAAGIRADDEPPPSLAADVERAGWLACSDLSRAIASLDRLAPRRERAVSSLLRELKFNLPAWAPRLPLDLWDGLHYGAWTLGMRMDNPETRRAREAAAWVDEQARSIETAAIVTHGGFRRLLTRQLCALGWRPSLPPRRYANWSSWVLQR